MNVFTPRRILINKHPDWLEENIDYVLSAENTVLQIKREVLLENACVKCRRQMGEHSFSATRGFICPP